MYIVQVQILGKKNHTLMNNVTIKFGSWSAMSASTGDFIWQLADPLNSTDSAAVTIANGVLYAGSGSGHFYALNAKTGAILFDYAAATTRVVCGPSIVEDDLYWGTGNPFQSVPTLFYAFTIN